MVSRVFTIRLHGRFGVFAPNGDEIIVVSPKVQALLAMITADRSMARQRSWIQDKLWSNDTHDNGGNSLRQALFKARKLFVPDKQVLMTNRSTVMLNKARVSMDPSTTGEFLEGMDIGEQEFENWLVAERLARQPDTIGQHQIERRPLATSNYITRPAASRALVLEQANDPVSVLGQKEMLFGDIVQRSVCEMLDIQPLTAEQAKSHGGEIIVLGLNAHPAAEGLTGLRIAIYQGLGAAPLWSDSVAAPFPMTGQPLGRALLNLSHRTSAALTDLICRPSSGFQQEDDPNYFAGAGLRRMYSMLPGSVQDAREMFDLAYELRPRGLYLALGAQLAVIDYVESGGKNREELTALSDELCTKAMVEESTNSIVLSAVAHARLVFDDDLVAASELSRMSVLANPSNPLAWSALANAQLNTENFEEAAQAARTAISLSKDTFFRYWTEFQFATTAVSMNQNDVAIKHAERARSLNPKYRPALRYLIGLHANKDSFDAARDAVTRLQRVEADVTPERFVEDEQYPVRMMRRAGLVDPGRFRDL